MNAGPLASLNKTCVACILRRYRQCQRRRWTSPHHDGLAPPGMMAQVVHRFATAAPPAETPAKVQPC